MAFRAYESAQTYHQRAHSRLVSKGFSIEDRERAEAALKDIVARCGPAVAAYPTWHPIVSRPEAYGRSPCTTPDSACGYRGLDHTVLFAHGFVTCPYDGGKEILRSFAERKHPEYGSLSIEVLDAPLYAENATPVLVTCEWDVELEQGHYVPKRRAVPLMVEQELPAWRWAQRPETWEDMRPYLLGQPHGGRSSLFVTQDTALAMKRVFVAMMESGMYGP